MEWVATGRIFPAQEALEGRLVGPRELDIDDGPASGDERRAHRDDERRLGWIVGADVAHLPNKGEQNRIHHSVYVGAKDDTEKC